MFFDFFITYDRLYSCIRVMHQQLINSFMWYFRLSLRRHLGLIFLTAAYIGHSAWCAAIVIGKVLLLDTPTAGDSILIADKLIKILLRLWLLHGKATAISFT